MASRTIDLKKLIFRPVTPARWPDLERLFGARGACGGCWCMAWRLRNKDWVAGKGARNKRAFRKIVKSGGRPGLLAYMGREPIAWCSLAPREQYLSLANSRVLKPVDDQPVWSVSCLFVLKRFRRAGVSSRLLRAAVEFAGKLGARIVEGYPVIPTMEKTPDPFIWTGVPSAFLKAGFQEVVRRSKTRPIMRRKI
ncbi:MAG: GNAT family N-acetyltransferase [Acidobacteria bacterium]|nr:GNAT family N-acetyltransferase [Acidobacteriota bacterium]